MHPLCIILYAVYKLDTMYSFYFILLSVHFTLHTLVVYGVLMLCVLYCVKFPVQVMRHTVTFILQTRRAPTLPIELYSMRST